MSGIWECKIGRAEDLPRGADAPLRQAVEAAYLELTGRRADFCFSGWGAVLTDAEQEAVNNA